MDDVPLLIEQGYYYGARKNGPLWKRLVITLGGLLIALLAGTTNGFNLFSESVQKDMSLSNVELGLVSGLGLLGVYFTIPVGYILDRWGPVRLSLMATLCVSSGYVAMSFIPTEPHGMWVLLLLSYLLVTKTKKEDGKMSHMNSSRLVLVQVVCSLLHWAQLYRSVQRMFSYSEYN